MVKFKRRVKKKVGKVSKPVKKYVKRAIHRQIEDKASVTQTTALTPIAVATTATAGLMNGIANGTSITTRIGEKITMTYLDLQMEVGYAGAGLPAMNEAIIYRIMVIYDRQSNGAGITLNQLWWLPGAGESYFSPLNPAGFPRYRILYDKQFTAHVEGGVINTSANKLHRIRKRLKLKTKYNNDTGSTIAAINTGALHYIICADSDGLVYKMNSIIRYEDA